MNDHTPVIRITNGTVPIDGRPVLRHIELTVAAGEFVALMGANGSGKSTLVRTMTGLRPVSAGSVELFGTQLDRFKDWHRLGFVPQRPAAGGGVPTSVWEVVAAGRLSQRRPFVPMSKRDRQLIREALEVVGLADRARDGIATLSGGQQQRVLTARALASQPELILLDEPTAGVDLPNQQALADALQVLKERNVTVVLVAHELGAMQPLVDRAVVMRDGQIAYDGPPLADHEVHGPLFGSGHSHHHGDPDDLLTPLVASPIDNTLEADLS